eukprot:1099539-Prymnesium_polylepis.1
MDKNSTEPAWPPLRSRLSGESGVCAESMACVRPRASLSSTSITRTETQKPVDPSQGVETRNPHLRPIRSGSGEGAGPLAWQITLWPCGAECTRPVIKGAPTCTDSVRVPRSRAGPPRCRADSRSTTHRRRQPCPAPTTTPSGRPQTRRPARSAPSCPAVVHLAVSMEAASVARIFGMLGPYSAHRE